MGPGWTLILLGVLCLCSLHQVDAVASLVNVELSGVTPKTTLPCKFPFTYLGNNYVGCTNAGSAQPTSFWCSVDPNYTSNRWGYCPATLNKPSITTPSGGTCDFPQDVAGPNITTGTTTKTSKVRFYECNNALDQAAAGTTPITGQDLCIEKTTNQYVACSACVDNFVRKADTSLPGGTLTSTTPADEDACKAACRALTQDQCGGYDYNTLNQCYILKNSLFSVVARPDNGVIHAVRIKCGVTTTLPTPTPTAGACVDTFNRTANANQHMGVIQPGVNTLDDCRANCLKVTTCTGFDYQTTRNECWQHLTTAALNTGATNVDHYTRVACNITGPVPCVDKFKSLPGKQLFDGTGAPNYNGNRLGCEGFCLSQTTCTHYEVDANGQCFWHNKPNGTTPVDVSVSHILYERIPCQPGTTPSVVCEDTFTENKNMFKFGGKDDAAGTLTACSKACLARAELCVAYDFDSRNKCFLHSELTAKSLPNTGTGISHYVRNFICNGTSTAIACVDTFAETKNRNRGGGTPVTTVSTKAACETECLKTQKPDPNTCYGYDFNSGDNSCYHHVGKIATQTNAFNGVNTYERRFDCLLATTVGAAVCIDTFVESANSNAFDGAKKNPVTEPACRALCVTTKMGDPNSCYGYDFDGKLNECWFQEKADYTINTGNAPGVTHYKRTTVCPSTVTGVVCVEQYTTTVDRNAANGVDVGAVSLANCKSTCENMTDCYGFDFTSSGCWLLKSKDYTLNPGPSPGVTNYRRQFNCVGVTTGTGVTGTGGACVETFTKKKNIIIYGGVPNPAITVATCATACRMIEGCLGYNFVRAATTDNCYTYTGVLGTEIQNNDLDLYIKDDNCAGAGQSTTPMSLCTMDKAGDGNVVGGKLVNNVNTLANCLKYCIDTPSCLAVDYDKLLQMCFWFTTSGGTPSGKPCCEHYTKSCTGRCVETYNVTSGRGYLGGTEVVGRNTLVECQAACTESTTCDGIDFEKVRSLCYVHVAANLGPSGSSFTSPDVDHYRRVRCPGGTVGRTTLPTTIRTTLCPTRFDEFKDQNAIGGVAEGTAGSSSKSICMDACMKSDACVAFDFDRLDRACFLHRNTPATRNNAPGVDHYVKVPCPTLIPITPTVTPVPSSCNIDLGFILESSTSNNAATVVFQREVMRIVIGTMNFGRNALRVSTRRFATTSEKFLTVQTANFYNRSEILNIVRGQSVNANLGQAGKDLELALRGFLDGNPTGNIPGEIADSAKPTPGARVNVVVLLSDLNVNKPLLPSIAQRFRRATEKIIVVPLSAIYNTANQLALEGILIQPSGLLNAQDVATRIIQEIRNTNAFCIGQPSAK